jgi:hypothetical protein
MNPPSGRTTNPAVIVLKVAMRLPAPEFSPG